MDLPKLMQELRTDEGKDDSIISSGIQSALDELDQQLSWFSGLSDGRQRALVNMDFNMGWKQLSEEEDFLTAMETGDWRKAARELERSQWGRSMGVRSLRLLQLVVGG